ncbi:MAG: NUDIX hydrolase [Nitrospirae bacterium]|nr:MAG: NUDIX hydrolase [Nitrospirota bacterium]
MKYCSTCGAQVRRAIPPGDTIPRFVCRNCGTIHYENPKIVVGCLPEWEDCILLCRRAIAPRVGCWTFPAGFMENDESTEEGAIRETWEEAQTRVSLMSLYAVFSLLSVNQVYLIFRGKMIHPTFGASAESSEVRLFREHEIPWEELAFPVIRETLTCYYHDRRTGQFPLHVGTIGDHRPPVA